MLRPENHAIKVANWWANCLYDFGLWPINLVRDLPLRLERLRQTARAGLSGLILFGPQLWQAQQRKELNIWLCHLPKRVAGWSHTAFSQLFDLVGGPEIAQFLMHLFTHTTPLTPTEISMIRDVLGPQALRFGEVRVAEGGLFDLIFKWNGNLAFATWRTINLPRTGRHTRANLPMVVHELTHVFQYERVGSRYLGEAIYMLVTTKRDCYGYGDAAGLQMAQRNGIKYCDYNREQQAKITQDYFTRKQKGSDVTAYEPFIAQMRKGDI